MAPAGASFITPPDLVKMTMESEKVLSF